MLASNNSLEVNQESKNFKRVERAKRHAKANVEESKNVHTTVRRMSDVNDHNSSKQDVNSSSTGHKHKTLFMSESIAKQKQSKFSRQTNYVKQNPVLVLKEKKNKKLRIYHICNVNDITNLKSIEQDEKRRVTMMNIQNEKFNSIANANSDDEYENQNYDRESPNFDGSFEQEAIAQNSSQNFDFGYHNARPSAAFFGRESVTSAAGGAGYGRSSIMNFKSDVTKQKFRESKANFQVKVTSAENEEYEQALAKKMKEIDQRLERECHNCKYGCKENHIIELSDCMEESDEDRSEIMDNPWKNISDTDVIEQVIFDPKLGMIKREIHFGIIDYITNFTLMKKIEEKIKGVIQDDPSAVRPPVYASRFIDCAKSAFE